MKRKVEIISPPKRIVSLVPSQTELLYELGLDEEIVGQTKFCIHPHQKHLTKPKVGGTKNVNIEKILTLEPDLIIGNKEENDKSSIEQLMNHFPVWMSDIQTLDDALEMIRMLGDIVGKEIQSASLVREIKVGFEALNQFEKKNRIAYFIWRNPWMVAGYDTFINQMINKMGGINVFENEMSRYPQVSNEQIVFSAPDIIFLSSEPYPFKEKHIAELQILCKGCKIILVDGEMFSWYGSRLRNSASYFNSLINQLQTTT